MNLPIVSVYITTFYSFARSLCTVMVIANLVRVLGEGDELELYCDGHNKFGQVLGGGGTN